MSNVITYKTYLERSDGTLVCSTLKTFAALHKGDYILSAEIDGTKVEYKVTKIIHENCEYPVVEGVEVKDEH